MILEKIVPLCTMLPKMSAYKRDFDEIKYMSFLIKDNELLKKYNKIWYKISRIIKNGFYSEPVCNDKYLKTKIKSYEGKVNTNVHNDKMSKEGFHCICLLVLLIDSVFKMGKTLKCF